MSMYIILILLAVLIAAASLILYFTRRRISEMDGLGRIREPGEDADDSVIASFGEAEN